MIKNLDQNFIVKCYEEEKQNIWLAPAEGLYLSNINFYGYNQKNDVKVKLEQGQLAKEKTLKFKQQVIYPQILSAEINESKFSNWLIAVKTNNYE